MVNWARVLLAGVIAATCSKIVTAEDPSNSMESASKHQDRLAPGQGPSNSMESASKHQDRLAPGQGPSSSVESAGKRQDPSNSAESAVNRSAAGVDEDEWFLQNTNYDYDEWLRASGQLYQGRYYQRSDVVRRYLNEAAPASNAGGEPNLCINGRLAPEFFLIGAQKASTTSFSAEFFGSPAVVHPEFFGHDYHPRMHMKELHIFDEEIRYGKGQKWWLDHYIPCSHARRLIAVDMTPNYMLQPKAPARMLSWYGSHAARLKFMVLLRDPVSRMQSAFYHGKEAGWCGDEYVGKTFQEYAQRFVSEYEASPDTAWNIWASHCTAVRGSAYAQQLKLWFTTFASRQFTIVPLAFQTDRSLTPYGPKSVAQKMCEDLGIPGSARKARARNVHAHRKLEDDLPSALLDKLNTAIYRHTGPKTVATILFKSETGLYGFPKAGSRSIPNISYWLEQHW